MNRPLDPKRGLEEQRREKRAEYSEILRQLNCSDLVSRIDPEDHCGYPARIFKWQYDNGVILPDVSHRSDHSKGAASPKDVQYFAERQFGLARKLAIFLVADEAGMSAEYLRKLCRNFEPKLPYDSPIELG